MCTGPDRGVWIPNSLPDGQFGHCHRGRTTNLSMSGRQMPVDQKLLAEVSAAAGRVTELEDQLEGARAEYRRTVRRLHLAGASMRELAEALGISHQRVHQIIEDGGVRRWRRRRRKEPTAQRVCSFAGANNDTSASSSQGPAPTSATPASWPPSASALLGDRQRIRPCGRFPPASSFLCSFCGKARIEVQALVSGPSGEEHEPRTICDESLGLCGEILSEQLR